MRIYRKMLVFLTVLLCASTLLTTASAATQWSAGTRTVQYDDEGIDFTLQGSIYYNSFTSTGLDIDAMHTRVWNNGIDIANSYFYAGNATRAEHSEDYWAQFWGLGGGTIPNGASNRLYVLDWSVLTDLYDQDTLYSYTSTEFCLTRVGVSCSSYDYFYYEVVWMPSLERTIRYYF